MHEISIAEDMVSIVLEVARKEHIKKVTKVKVQFGQMVQIVPDIFIFAAEEAVKGTLIKGAAFCIEIIPIMMRCKDCQTEFNITDNYFYCTKCQSVDIEIINGNEMLVKSIEGE